MVHEALRVFKKYEDFILLMFLLERAPLIGGSLLSAALTPGFSSNLDELREEVLTTHEETHFQL